MGEAEADPRSPRGDVAKVDLKSAMLVLLSYLGNLFRGWTDHVSPVSSATFSSAGNLRTRQMSAWHDLLQMSPQQLVTVSTIPPSSVSRSSPGQVHTMHLVHRRDYLMI